MSTQLCGGHTESVLCVVVGAEGRVISGGERGELCLWSLGGGSVQRTRLPGEGESCDVTSVVYLRSRPDEVYVAGGSCVYHYDTRRWGSGPLSPPLTVSDDDINELTLNGAGTRLAAACDTGAVTVVHVGGAAARVERTLRGHANICTTVAYRPGGVLASGGFDGALLQWDVTRARCCDRVAVRDCGLAAGERPAITPPFVHSLAVAADGRWLAAGTENALVEVFDARRRRLVHRRTLTAHTRGVSHVHFAGDVMLTGANDGRLLAWRVADFGRDAPPNGRGDGGARHDTIEHGQKINWMASGQHANRRVIVVADTTPNLTVYPFPE